MKRKRRRKFEIMDMPIPLIVFLLTLIIACVVMDARLNQEAVEYRRQVENSASLNFEEQKEFTYDGYYK